MNKPDLKEAPPCRYIKSKNSFGMLEDGGNWSGIEDPNASYWCNKTAGPVGPDNAVVGPKQCIEGRKCYLIVE